MDFKAVFCYEEDVRANLTIENRVRLSVTGSYITACFRPLVLLLPSLLGVGFLQYGLPFFWRIGFPGSSSAGLGSHFLLLLTCMIFSLTVPTRDLSLQRFDWGTCFSTTGI